ncbi:hypothetical protein MAR_035848, partial [Mya arenaria]
MRLNFNLGGFVEVALPCSKNRKLLLMSRRMKCCVCYMEAARGGFKWPTVEDVSWEHHSSVTRHLDNPVLDIQKSSNHSNVLAEVEENAFKDQDRSGGAQDSEGLARKQGFNPTHLVCHESSNGTSNLVVPALVPCWAQQYEHELCGHRHLRQVTHHAGVLQADKPNYHVVEEIYLTNEDVGCVGAWRDLLHEPRLVLE